MHCLAKSSLPYQLMRLGWLVLLVGFGIGKQASAEEPPKFRWALPFNWAANAFDITVDDMGNSYFTGQAAQNTVIVGTNVLLNDQRTVLLGKCDSAGRVSWAVRDGQPLPIGWGVGVDGSYNVRVLCGLYGGAQSNSIAGTNISGVLALAKYDRNGNGLRAASLARALTVGSQVDVNMGLAVDSAGNSFWSINLGGTVQFGDAILTSPTNLAAVLGRCDPEGSVVWAKMIASSTHPYGVVFSAPVLAPSGCLFIVGDVRDTCSFAGTNLSAHGESDTFLAKYNSNGDLLWIRQGGGEGTDYARAVSVDAAGNSFVGGAFFQSATFSQITLTNQLATNYNFVAKYDQDGNVLWVKQLCVGSFADRVTADPDGNCYVAAECATGGVLYVKYDRDGNEAWSKAVQSLRPYTFRADALGHCYVLGHLGWDALTTDLDGTVLSGSDKFLAKLDTTTLPRLGIASASDSLILTWPVLADDFYLESTPAAGPASWNSNSVPPSLIGSTNSLTIPRSGDATFFRLKHR